MTLFDRIAREQFAEGGGPNGRLARPSEVLQIVTNATASRQPSMIGYGELILREMQFAGLACAEVRGSSILTSLASDGRMSWALRRADRFFLTPVQCAGRRAAVVHTVDPGNAVYLPLFRAGAWSATVHDMVPYLAAEGRLEGFRPSRVGRRLMKTILAVLRRADAIVTVSEATRQDLVRIGDIDPGRIKVIPNALFQKVERATEDECTAFRARNGLPPEAPILLNIGRNFYKNRAGVVEVFRRVALNRSDAHLVFVGSPTPDLSAAILRGGLSGRVSFIPHIAEEDISACYSAASILLFPSLYEGFGYPVLEAQLAGTPVVCSDAGSLAEVAGEGARVHRLDDLAAMAVSALEILGDPVVAADLVDRGRRNAKRFTLDLWKKRYLHHFAALGASAS
jgi:glycosyltransferase involved in cell wall biosynthesis